MTITISPELSEQVREKARAEGLGIEGYVERLIREDEEWVEFSEELLNETDSEFVDIRAAVSEGLQQSERGEGRPAQQVFAELRKKHGLPR